MTDKPDNAARLNELRDRIDALDDRLIELISERGEIAVEIGRVKADDGTPVYAPHREKAVLERIQKANTGPFPDSVLRAVYRELMSGSLAIENPPCPTQPLAWKVIQFAQAEEQGRNRPPIA